MRFISLCIVLAVSLCVVSCSPSNDGLFELPVRNPSLVEITVPPGDLVSGEVYDFTAVWLDGRPNFDVAWQFDGGTDPLVSTANTADNNHTLSVIAVSEETGPVEYAGRATVVDFHGNSTSLTFSYTVIPVS